MEPTLALTQALIRRPLRNSGGRGLPYLIAERLEALGFHCERMDEGGLQSLGGLGHGRPDSGLRGPYRRGTTGAGGRPGPTRLSKVTLTGSGFGAGGRRT